MYTAILLGITSLVSVFLLSFGVVKGLAGPFLLLLFVLYVASIAYMIYRGLMTAPMDSDSSSSSSSDSESEFESDSDMSERTLNNESSDSILLAHKKPEVPTIKIFLDDAEQKPKAPKGIRKPLQRKAAAKKQRKPVANKRPKTLRHHIFRLLFGFGGLSLACYVLSHSIASVGDALGLSGSLVGITVLSLATTLPEKFVAIVGGARGQGGIVIANAVGSNIFLLTLCAGTLFIFGDVAVLEASVHVAEIGLMWFSSLALAGCVFFGADRKVGFGLLGLYVLFIILEFTYFRAGEGSLEEIADDIFRR
jgi:Ca2+/Na+ antiporter